MRVFFISLYKQLNHLLTALGLVVSVLKIFSSSYKCYSSVVGKLYNHINVIIPYDIFYVEETLYMDILRKRVLIWLLN